MHRHLAAFLVVVSAGAVLVLELLSARLVAPYVGVTHEVYTASIGVALGAIALGAALGGRAADVREGRLLIGWLFAAGGALVLLARPLVLAIGPGLRGLGPIAAVILIGLAIALPVALLSAVAPVVVKMRLAGLEHAGATVGWFSALGTIGGLLGTFLTGFLLLQALPVSTALLVTGLLLLGLGTWQLAARVFGEKRGLPPGSLSRTMGIAAITVVGGGLLLGTPTGCQLETAYYCARVEPDPQRPSGRILMLDDLRHAYVDVSDPTYLHFDYTQMFAEAIDDVFADDRPLRTLHVGGGGLTMQRWLDATRPDSEHTVLELDPHVLDLVQDEMGVRTGPNLTVRAGDARISIQDQPDNSYDLVIGDAFSQSAVPWHLATREFAQEVDRVLRPDGLFVMNVIDYPPGDLVAAEIATIRSVLGEVRVLGEPPALRGESGGNFVLVAGEGVGQLRSEAEAPAKLYQEWSERGRVLTDDWAPVDQLLSPYA